MTILRLSAHPNRLPFYGVLTQVDTPSDKAPTGARGHRVFITKAAGEEALESLIGMAINYRPGFALHDRRCKIGVITHAKIVGRDIRIQGYLYALDFPDVIAEIRAQEVMGMSYELAKGHVADLTADVWKITKAVFAGAAIVLRNKAAYKGTTFVLERINHAWDPKKINGETVFTSTAATEGTTSTAAAARTD